MEVTATEFKQNLGKYLKLSTKEAVAITKNGKKIAVLYHADNDHIETANKLTGIIKVPQGNS